MRYFCFSFNVHICTNYFALCKAYTAGTGIFEGHVCRIAFYMIGRAVNDVTINGIFGAGGDTLFDMYSLAVCMWCLAIPLAAAGTYFFPLASSACICVYMYR